MIGFKQAFSNFFDPPKPPTDEDESTSTVEEDLKLDYHRKTNQIILVIEYGLCPRVIQPTNSPKNSVAQGCYIAFI